MLKDFQIYQIPYIDNMKNIIYVVEYVDDYIDNGKKREGVCTSS